jgi:hypothetical protein
MSLATKPLLGVVKIGDKVLISEGKYKQGVYPFGHCNHITESAQFLQIFLNNTNLALSKIILDHLILLDSQTLAS